MKSKVWGTIDPLSMGQGIVEGSERFQLFTYDKIPLPDGTLLVRHKGRAYGQTSRQKNLISLSP